MISGEINKGKESFQLKPTISKWPAVSITGFSAGIIYCLLTLLSFLLFPSLYSPINNNLSQLGDFNDNQELFLPYLKRT
ncbi:MAG: hypothetical protein ACXADA_10250 [Candidatus Hodarchaeales archaeon]